MGVTNGGPGAGKLQLTVQPTLLTPFVVSLPTERVLEGHITAASRKQPMGKG